MANRYRYCHSYCLCCRRGSLCSPRKTKQNLTIPVQRSHSVSGENRLLYGKTLLRNHPTHYLLTAAFGILGGLLVAFLHGFTANGLWAAAHFSTSDFGFWMFTTALLVLWSEKRVTACVNAGLYIFFMFLVTTVCMSLGQFDHGGTPYPTLPDMIWHSLPGWLWYSVPPALLCVTLAAVLWNGRKSGIFGAVLRWLPLAFLVLETGYWFCFVFTQKTRLFAALIDLLCAAGYFVLILLPAIRRKRGDKSC